MSAREPRPCGRPVSYSVRHEHEADSSVTTRRPKALAFYLPQYHPIPENDAWWGAGFTEWTNVVNARPLFPGHYQPRVPAELGYYDLRSPAVRTAQAALAREHGIEAFCYYHYWFAGRRLLERPFEEVLASGEPDFPFCLCWANKEWTRGWDCTTGHVLVEKRSAQPTIAVIFVTCCGRSRILATSPSTAGHCCSSTGPSCCPISAARARSGEPRCQKAGFPGLYLCWVEDPGDALPAAGPDAFGLDAAVGFMPVDGSRTAPSARDASRPPGARLRVGGRTAMGLRPPWKRFPAVMVGWDNTARRGPGRHHLPRRHPGPLRAMAEGHGRLARAGVRSEENYLFILAWNEWAEGNHLEPDQRYGRAFLEATRAVLVDSRAIPRQTPALPGQPAANRPVAAEPRHHGTTGPMLGEAAANVAGLLAELELPEGRQVVDLAEQRVAASQQATTSYPGIDVVPGPFSDVASLKATLDGIDDIGALLLTDVLQHLAEPQELLTALAAWSLDHGSPPLLGHGTPCRPRGHGPPGHVRSVRGSGRPAPSIRRTCAISPRTLCNAWSTAQGGAW